MYYRDALAALIDRSVEAGLAEPAELELKALKLTVWAGVLAGFVILNTVKLLFGRKIERISVPYSILVGVFFALIIIIGIREDGPFFLSAVLRSIICGWLPA